MQEIGCIIAMKREWMNLKLENVKAIYCQVSWHSCTIRLSWCLSCLEYWRRSMDEAMIEELLEQYTKWSMTTLIILNTITPSGYHGHNYITVEYPCTTCTLSFQSAGHQQAHIIAAKYHFSENAWKSVIHKRDNICFLRCPHSYSTGKVFPPSRLSEFNGACGKGRQHSAYTVYNCKLQYCSWLTPCPCGSSIAVLATLTKNYAERVGSGRQ